MILVIYNSASTVLLTSVCAVAWYIPSWCLLIIPMTPLPKKLEPRNKIDWFLGCRQVIEGKRDWRCNLAYRFKDSSVILKQRLQIRNRQKRPNLQKSVKIDTKSTQTLQNE